MTITDIAQLDEIYGPPMTLAVTKVRDHITPCYRTWISASRFVILSTTGPEGTDASPRGDDGPVVRIDDPKTLMLPDWMGNNRIDSLRNIVRDPLVSLMFMVPGVKNVVRVNGRAVVRADADLLASFDRKGKQPRTVVQITVEEVYFQCAKALMRSNLWGGEDLSKVLPTAGDFLHEKDGGFDGATYDDGYEVNAQPRMW
ncbi:pyridoxamine 5'-phosphate oxidase family protein [Pseudooceanicola sp. MF1-13]|uniref:pyridoxamine 5'-phosphate oxidase family protein n=1 Tax=Pseudooceanicola sp. MF1-13 TaxID=3379095 RepID=UPI003891D287